MALKIRLRWAGVDQVKFTGLRNKPYLDLLLVSHILACLAIDPTPTQVLRYLLLYSYKIPRAPFKPNPSRYLPNTDSVANTVSIHTASICSRLLWKAKQEYMGSRNIADCTRSACEHIIPFSHSPKLPTFPIVQHLSSLPPVCFCG